MNLKLNNMIMLSKKGHIEITDLGDTISFKIKQLKPCRLKRWLFFKKKKPLNFIANFSAGYGNSVPMTLY